ncbi:ubiquitin-like-conjugating enzyme ATG10 [Nasonia vitripennis]|uniref:Ubiquitin-like-conjugating enzyme ATG10 n=1 Tax=Nasonia vitripennis TaxID=7425 RepID=A0A7M7PWZ6_NASVI|nr:ubiquitin-like-conjugating enzyme ATG10 [Nasonia vitripennis]
MDGPGTITWEEFVANAEELLELSEEISDRWEFPGDKNCPGQAYLKRQEKTLVSIDYPIDEPQEDVDDWTGSRDPFEASGDQKRPLILEHHVLWSMSYSVPVIYFNGWKSDFPGINPVSVELAQRLNSERLGYGELSQAMHPLLARPFLHLHPCGSRELLQLTGKSANSLVSWLSLVAPVALNLRMRPEYFRLTLSAEQMEKDEAEE